MRGGHPYRPPGHGVVRQLTPIWLRRVQGSMTYRRFAISAGGTRLRQGRHGEIENLLVKNTKAGEHGDPHAVTVPDSSRSIHQSLSRRHDPTGQALGSRRVVDLVGRSAELELIEALLAGRGPAGHGLLLRGDPGVGKTALLDAAVERAQAAGIRVLRA